jgi:dTDP-4-amino-4,6-dideoxygalactose transaminase
MIPQENTLIPFFRPSITDAEVNEVTDCLRSGWLTSGPRVKRFEEEFAAAVGGRHAIAVNSCTSALHLAVEALGLRAGQAVLVPTMTFAATAGIVLHQGGIPILVDCEPDTLNISLEDARCKIDRVRSDRSGRWAGVEVVGMIPVHVGGFMVDMDAVGKFAREHSLWVVEDAAHSLPAAYRTASQTRWRRCGEATASVTCFSFYANKTITTGEGGMAVTEDDSLASRIRSMSLHGLSNDAWERYRGGGWDYRIQAPGYKYNLTDLAAAIGIHQLARAESLRKAREEIASRYLHAFSSHATIGTPPVSMDRLHSWHLFPIRMNSASGGADRDHVIAALASRGIGTSVHWRPLHLHPFYQQKLGYRADDCPVASRVWPTLVSLPVYPGMTAEEVDRVTVEVMAQTRRMAA